MTSNDIILTSNDISLLPGIIICTIAPNVIVSAKKRRNLRIKRKMCTNLITLLNLNLCKTLKNLDRHSFRSDTLILSQRWERKTSFEAKKKISRQYGKIKKREKNRDNCSPAKKYSKNVQMQLRFHKCLNSFVRD